MVEKVGWLSFTSDWFGPLSPFVPLDLPLEKNCINRDWDLGKESQFVTNYSFLNL